MKFCSVGTVITQRELKESESIQYLFDANTPKPSDIASVINILPNARSISFDIDPDKNLNCSPLAGVYGARLYLTYMNIKDLPLETQSTLTFPTTFSRTTLDLFKLFCLAPSLWESGSNFSTSTQGILKKGDIGYGGIKNTPYRYYVGDGSVLATQMVLMPTRLTQNNLKATQPVDLSVAQNYTYSYSSYNSFGRWEYTRVYTSYLNQLKVSMDGNCKATATAISPSVVGTTNFSRTTESSPGIYLVRSSYQEYYYTPYSSSYSYRLPEYTSANAVAKNLTALPFVASSEPDENVSLGFGISATRRKDEIRLVVRDFISDLLQSGSDLPNTVPTVTVKEVENFEFEAVLDL
ncbi:hypothetical protein JA33_082 [Dickeya phage vB_DsoM_JA33]|uniref:Uncharacterized protein n=2 Tax=Salmondvirus JA11 TaxID=2734141 RepID=A0A386K6D0_9CAUD|nr:hypothetical protein HOU32_gp082 [Dickeya phage vB_DsoM_JA11]AXG67456.1 hypothetical protein JA33_082 [Dickeya phage vB_DsoM_JA33]AYD79887.1 hypothetical protein JA11_082 [Dickeya phage vB_DsoM_JA11]